MVLKLLFLVEVRQHEAGKHRHDHLVLHLADVLRQGVDRSSNFPCNGDAVLSIGQTVLIKYQVVRMSLLTDSDPYRPSYNLPLLDDGEVNQSRVDDIYQVNNRQGCLDSLNVKKLEY